MEVQIFDIEGGKLMIMDSLAMGMKNFDHRKIDKSDMFRWIFPGCFYIFEKANLDLVKEHCEKFNIKYEISEETGYRGVQAYQEPDGTYVVWQSNGNTKNVNFKRSDLIDKMVFIRELGDSFELHFAFDKTIIEFLKKIDPKYRSFDKQTKNWKITNLHIEEFKQHLKKSKIYFEYVTF